MIFFFELFWNLKKQINDEVSFFKYKKFPINLIRQYSVVRGKIASCGALTELRSRVATNTNATPKLESPFFHILVNVHF